MSPSTGIENGVSGGNVAFVYSVPTNAEKPKPNRLNASPVAYWLVLSQITSTPNTAASAAPVAAPASRPSQVLPLMTATITPATAAHNIMPSAPRLTMPTFSLISNPSAAIAKAVPELNTRPSRPI